MKTKPQINKIEDLSNNLSRRYTSGDSDQPNKDDSHFSADREQLARDGFIILKDLFKPDEVQAIREACKPQLDHKGRNNFEGLKTQRAYNLLAKSRVFDNFADHPVIRQLLSSILQPNYLLSQTQIINILPGETAQLLHYDDAFYQFPRPRPPLGVASILAIDDFTDSNGATTVVPGSHLWSQDRIPTASETIPVVMPAGSVVIFLGTLWHGGGTNRSDASRLALTCQYCEPWLRQQENFLLELDNSTVRGLSESLQSMIGYSIHPPFMGMVDGKHPRRLLDDN